MYYVVTLISHLIHFVLETAIRLWLCFMALPN